MGRKCILNLASGKAKYRIPYNEDKGKFFQLFVDKIYHNSYSIQDIDFIHKKFLAKNVKDFTIGINHNYLLSQQHLELELSYDIFKFLEEYNNKFDENQ